MEEGSLACQMQCGVMEWHWTRRLGGWHSCLHFHLICLKPHDGEKPPQLLCERITASGPGTESRRGLWLPGSAMSSLASSALAKCVETPEFCTNSIHLCLYLHLTPAVWIMPSKVSLINVHSSTVSACALGTDVPGALGDYGLFPRSQGLSGWIIISLAVK